LRHPSSSVSTLEADLSIRSGGKAQSHQAHEDDGKTNKLDFHGETFPLLQTDIARFAVPQLAVRRHSPTFFGAKRMCIKPRSEIQETYRRLRYPLRLDNGGSPILLVGLTDGFNSRLLGERRLR